MINQQFNVDSYQHLVVYSIHLGAPILLKSRLIIQRLCKNNLNWNEPIDGDTAQEWLKSRNNLGISSYIRLLNGSVQVHCTLLIGKSSVAHLLKFVSIPMLELIAATVSVVISKMLEKELDIHVDDEVSCNDSNTVLGYINSDVCWLKRCICKSSPADKRQYRFQAVALR